MKHKRRYFSLTRADVIKAFSGHEFSRQQTMELVAKYMGESDRPPNWSYVGVRGMLGKRAARRWARYLRHRHSGSNIHVQTVYDFGVTPEEFAKLGDRSPWAAAAAKMKDAKAMPDILKIIVDEWSLY